MSWQEKRKKEIDILLELIEKKVSINKEELCSKSRKKPLVMTRRLLLNILFEFFYKDEMTHDELSEVINRDRCSFIYHRKEHLNEYSRYKKYKEEYDIFKAEYKELINS